MTKAKFLIQILDLMKKYIIIILTSYFSFQMQAQSSFEAGLFVGASVYNGDIDVGLHNFLPQMRPAVGVLGRYYLWPNIALRGQFNAFKLYGDEGKYPSSSYRKQRGFSFETPVREVVLQGEWHIFHLDKNLRFDKDASFISLYGFGGVAGVFFNPKTDYNEPNPLFEDVSADKNANFSKRTLALLGGGGVKMMLNDRLALGGEVSVRRSNSDYLDGISKVINSRATDYYLVTGVTLTYAFGGGEGGKNGVQYSRGSKNIRRFTNCPRF